MADFTAFPIPYVDISTLNLGTSLADTYANSLSGAITAIGATETTLLVDEPTTVATSLTVPATLTLKFEAGGLITKSGSGAINFLGPGVDAKETDHVFSGFAAGDIKWTGIYPDWISIKWWGAVGDSPSGGVGTDDKHAFDCAIASLQAETFDGTNGAFNRLGTRVKLPPAQPEKGYRISDRVHIYRHVELEGAAQGQSAIFPDPGKGGFRFHRYNTFVGTPAGGTGTESGDSVLRNVLLYGTYGVPDSFTGTVLGLTITRTAGTTLDHPIRKGHCVKFDGVEFIISDQDFTAQTLTLEPYRMSASIQQGSPTLTKNGYGDFPAGNIWAGGTVNVDGDDYTILSHTTRVITLTTNYTGRINTGPYGGSPTWEGDAEVNALPSLAARSITLLTGHGIDLYAKVRLENVNILQFSGNGINTDTDNNPPGTSANDLNANYSLYENVVINSCEGNAFNLTGFNSNVITLSSCSTVNNHCAGFYAGDFHGNYYSGCHGEANWQGTYYRGNLDAGAHNDFFAGCYSEGGQPSSIMGAGFVIGGTHGAGFSRDSKVTAMYPLDGGASSPMLFGGGNTTFKPNVFAVGGDASRSTSTYRQLAAFGINEEPHSRNLLAGSIIQTLPSVFLNHGNTHDQFYTWEHANSWASMGISDGQYEMGGGVAAFHNGILLGDLSGPRRWLTVMGAAPATYKRQIEVTVDTNGTAVTWSENASGIGHSHFDASGAWDGLSITINAVSYTIDTVTDSTHLTLTATAGVQNNVNGTFNLPWQKGDIVFNNNPSPGGTLLWICTTSGVPGTWTAVGMAGGGGGIGGSSGATDNAILRADGTGGATAQSSGATVEDDGTVVGAQFQTPSTAGNSTTMSHHSGSGAGMFTSNGVTGMGLVTNNSTVVVPNSFQFAFSSTSSVLGGTDTGLSRAAAGIVGVTDGSTGGGALSFTEITAPSAPAANKAYLFIEDNGSGKSRLMVQFATGAAQQIAIEP